MGRSRRLTAKEAIGAGLFVAYAVAGLLERPQAHPIAVHAGIETVIILLLIAALAAAAAIAMRSQPKTSSPIRQKNNPTTLVDEGSYTPLLAGRRVVGPMFAWAGKRRVVSEEIDSGGGKGGGGSSGAEQLVYFECAWHVLSVGQGRKLWNIRKDGKIVFRGPITPESHPSGTTVDFGPPGAFTIYWGELDQAVNASLGAANKVDIASAWPGFFYVEWTDRRLGTNATWGTYTYEIEVHPHTTLLQNTTPWMDGTKTLASVTRTIYSVTNGSPGYITVTGKVKNMNMRPGDPFRVTGNTMTPTEFTVDSTYYDKPTNRTTITCVEDISGANAVGHITPYQDITNDGANPAHVLAQFLFEPWPHGRNFPQDMFDIDSLEDLGLRCVAEGIPMSVYIRDGEKLDSAIGDIMTDLGCMCPLVPETGLYTFVPIRKPWGEVFDVKTIPSTMMVPPLPSIRSTLLPVTANRAVFHWGERTKKYVQATYKIDDDGNADLHGVSDTIEIDLETVIDTDTAMVVAPRRAQEAQSDVGNFKFNLNREGRRLYPGQAFVFEGYPGVMRIVEVEPVANSNKSTVSAIIDFYGAEADTLIASGVVSTVDDGSDVDEDAEFSFVEVPKYLSNGTTRIIVPRVRANDSIEKADIHISADATTYTRIGKQFSAQAGGRLNAVMPATSHYLSGSGPEFTIEGPDIANVLDLSGDDVNWRAGRQVLIIEDEIMFLDGISIIDEDTATLGRIIRGAYGTDIVQHDVGAKVFIFEYTKIEAWSDPLFKPDADISVKSQPFTGEAQPLDEIDPVTKTLVGRGVAPMRPENLRTTNMSKSFHAGADVPLIWQYRSSADFRTGAGLQPSGTASGVSDPEGVFVVELLTTGNVLKLTVGNITGRTTTITNAALVAAFGVEPSSFKARVHNGHGGYVSETIEATIVRV